jgi:hypothetical protein
LTLVTEKHVPGSKPGERRGGRKPGTPNKKITPRDLKTIAAAEALRREIEERRPTPTTELSEKILGQFAHNCAAMAVRLMPGQLETGELVFRFKEHEKYWKYMMEQTFKYANGAAPYQSPTFRAIMVTPPPETKAGDGARVINLTVFEGGKAVTTSKVVDDEIIRDEVLDEERRG